MIPYHDPLCNFYRDRIGGGTPSPLPFVYEIDVSTVPVRIVWRIDYRKRQRREGEEGEQRREGEEGEATDIMAEGHGDREYYPHGKPHPQIMGAASAVWRGKVIFFGGGSPLDASKINNSVTTFDIQKRRWETLWEETAQETSLQKRFERNEEGGGRLFPEKRQGLNGCVYGRKLYIFGGRILTRGDRGENGEEVPHKGCKNDLWSFDLIERKWALENPVGEIPAPRVWYASAPSVGKWLIIGGSLWDFIMPEDEEEILSYQYLYCLHFPEREGDQLRWERVRTQGVPQWVTAGRVVATGREILYLGGTKPQHIGLTGGITMDNVNDRRVWRKWYASIGNGPPPKDGRSRETETPPVSQGAGILDTRTLRWRTESRKGNLLEVSCRDGDLYRSHFAAAYVPPTGQIFIYGGSRYFLGDYFHDLFALDLPKGVHREKEDPNRKSRVSPGGKGVHVWRGQMGRIRGAVANEEVQMEAYIEMVAELKRRYRLDVLERREAIRERERRRAGGQRRNSFPAVTVRQRVMRLFGRRGPPVATSDGESDDEDSTVTSDDLTSPDEDADADREETD